MIDVAGGEPILTGMDLPVSRKVSLPDVLEGRVNGKLPDAILMSVPGQADGPTVRLVKPAARAWLALCDAARSDGHTLKAVSATDSFRPYTVQRRIFLERYTTTDNGTRPKVWKNRKWYLRPGNAVAAVPGKSNHGWALAVDTGIEIDGNAGTERINEKAVKWLVKNEFDFGFSHELQSEPWHIRYFTGDHIPTAVLDFERGTVATALISGADMPITDADAENIADAVWHRDSDPTDARVAAWIALNQARLDASAARKEVALLRKEFNKSAKQDPIDDKALLKSLLAALQPQEIADIVVGAVPPAVANEAADGIFSRVNNDPQDPESLDDQVPSTNIIGE
jgi:D-alanyl-D-alanine carboxypeptidase